MDKTSYFFTFQCGVCHPGGAAAQYDRVGNKYFDRSTGLFGYGSGVAALPAEAKLDGDYGFIAPKPMPDGTAPGTPMLANGWKKNGVLEPDCFLCHLSGYQWKNRSATIAGGSGITTNSKGQAVVAFEWAPAVGAGWGVATIAASPPFPPTASDVWIDYELGITSGTLVDVGGKLVIPAAKIGKTPETNCRGCHSTPDTRKSGRTLLDETDVHKKADINCTTCHPAYSKTDSAGNLVLDAKGNRYSEHAFGKGNITIGSVDNFNDGADLRSCAGCHLGTDLPPIGPGQPLAVAPPDPTKAHGAKGIPTFHFDALACQACHIRYLEDDAGSTGLQVPDLIIEMTSNGTQNTSGWQVYFTGGDAASPKAYDPLNPNAADPNLAGQPYRWYPGLRFWNTKVTTMKPLVTAWFGEWLGGAGNSAQIRPITLRLVRKALTGAYPAGSARLASLPLTSGGAPGTVPILYKRDEIKASLLALRDASDTANNVAGADTDIVVNPVMVRAEKVYYLDASGEMQVFESTVGESHDFAVNHNVVPKRADPYVKPGPYGAGGCADCHSPTSAFFNGLQLADPAQYDYGDPATPNAGKPVYKPHWEHIGYSESRAGELTGVEAKLYVNPRGSGRVTSPIGIDCVDGKMGGCTADGAVGSAVVLTAAPGLGMVPSWTGCTVNPSNRNECTVTMPAAKTTWFELVAASVSVSFNYPPAGPKSPSPGFIATVSGTAGNVSSGAPANLNCTTGNYGTCSAQVASGTVVSVTATPGAGSRFVRWEVCAGSCQQLTSPTIDVTSPASGATSITATFESDGSIPPPPPPSLIVVVDGRGTVTDTSGTKLSCRWGDNGDCIEYMASAGDGITLVATPDAGKSFVSWSGCTSVSGTSCTVTVTRNQSVRATFTW
jgi:hypothetical protein